MNSIQDLFVLKVITKINLQKVIQICLNRIYIVLLYTKINILYSFNYIILCIKIN
jgi:hypothetical protein